MLYLYLELLLDDDLLDLLRSKYLFYMLQQVWIITLVDILIDIIIITRTSFVVFILPKFVVDCIPSYDHCCKQFKAFLVHANIYLRLSNCPLYCDELM